MGLFHDTHRITKDTSARKSAGSAGSVSAIEVAAIRASHDAYVSSMKAGYEEQIDNLHSEHGAEIAMVKDEHAKAIAEMEAELAVQKTKLKSKVAEEAADVVAKHRQQWETAASNLREKIRVLSSQNEALSYDLKASQGKNKTDAAHAEKELARLDAKFDAMRAQAKEKIDKINAELAVGPNTWLEINFVSKRFRDRQLVKRPSETMAAAFGEVSKALGSGQDNYELEHQGKQILDRNLTLEQVSLLVVLTLAPRWFLDADLVEHRSSGSKAAIPSW